MPTQAARPCPVCHRSCKGSFCCNPLRHRASAYARGYTRDWQKARLDYLAEYPLCVVCLDEGVTEEATVVDHVIPHRGDMGLFWDTDNWQSLCFLHHNRKTGKGL